MGLGRGCVLLRRSRRPESGWPTARIRLGRGISISIGEMREGGWRFEVLIFADLRDW